MPLQPAETRLAESSRTRRALLADDPKMLSGHGKEPTAPCLLES